MISETIQKRFLILKKNLFKWQPSHQPRFNTAVPAQQRLDSYFTVTSPSKIQPTALTIRWSLHNNG